MATADASRRPGRLGVGVVGAGRVGAVLGAALRSAGHAVVGVSAVSAASLERAENLLPGVPVLEIPDIIERSELVLLAVPDDALPTLVEGLAQLGVWQAGQLVVHTSGRYGTSVLAPARAAGAIPLAIHPAMTFTGLSLDLGRLPDTMFGITAPAVVLPIAQALVVEMGAEPVVIEEESRALYHAALAHASNHLVTIAAQSAQLLADLGVQHPDRMLGPLMKASLENALSSGEGALTGPVARGDATTVSAHRAALEAHDAPDTRQAYLGMARATALRALERGVLSPGQGASILAALADRPAPGSPDQRPDARPPA
ncbi:DUF2520 domain-containing protein [Arthrobacter agilis]|uniref:Rossmann-like and DUF2520 domain-containing protein n=1 Tax=Arthrobacter agilis TaxID=37921 RepID=UPI000B35EB71|nr:DUF2520 domain-containing protein [Arthrobacter agilis]OUM42387.1 oxidoreductase [Arthrobacter agilis]PPB45728.1 DUF2520 domain-containing protein [Arthrobacter agilis]TPV26291.1 DUF2520 domain-containing protein [Arthrobacter agilis]WDF33462.1 DUF2520 domain-containing protein [Arthrobacter agilis]VDR30857.1 Uncharacterized conserved protein [Arthrobacter agilis]